MLPQFLISGVLLGFSLLAGFALADPQQPAPAAETSETVILKQLQQPVTVEYQETALEVVLDELATKTGTHILVNWKGLEEAGHSRDQPVSGNLKHVSGETALILLLKPLGLTWMVQDEVIQVITLSQATDVGQHGVLRVYDVTNLLRLAKVAGKPAAPAQPATVQFSIPPALKKAGEQIPGQFGLGHPYNPLPAQPPAEGAWLIDAVQSATSSPEGSWLDLEGSGGTITLVGQSLVVHQSYQTQRKIASLLRAMEAAYAGPPAAALLRVGSRDSYPLPRDLQILVDLNKPAKLEAAEMPLNEALEVLASQLGHPILLDIKALTDEGISPEEPVTVQVQDITLRSTLRIILDRVGLVPTVWEGTLYVTTKTADDNLDYARLAVCHVGHQPQKLLDQLVDSLQDNTGVSWLDMDGVGGTISTCPGGVLVIKQSERGLDNVARQLEQLFPRLESPSPPVPVQEEKPDADGLLTRYYRFPDIVLSQQLQKSLSEFVAPAEWKKNNGAAIQLFGTLLVIRQTPEMHQQVSAWLTRLSRHLELVPKPPTGEFQGLEFEFAPNATGHGLNGLLNGSGFFSVD